MILEAGRFSPTGGNLQNVSYYVSREDLAQLKSMTMSELRRMGEEVRRSGMTGARYPELWIEMDEAFRRDGTDKLFFNTDTVIVISSDSPQSACIAAAHMETMVYSLGLGMLYSGFAARAIAHSQTLREYLKIKEGYQAYAVLVIGHPAVEYVRTVPRKPADVIWN